MSDTLVLMLGEPPRWLRVSGDAVVARGEGAVLAETDDQRVVAVVPADDVTIVHADLPDLSEPQAVAAARLIVADQAASPADILHVAVGRENADGGRAVVAIDRARMELRLAEAALLGHDPDIILPAPLLIARPEAGFFKADLGGETVVRGPDRAFADDPVLTPLVAGDDVVVLDQTALQVSIANAVAAPEVDLRQGPFAKRRQWAIDWPLVRLIGWLALALAVLTLLLAIARVVRLDHAADRIDASNAEIARTALPANTTINAPLIQLNERLATLRGPGGGLLPLAASVAGAVNAAPNLQLGSMIFDGGGSLRITVRANNPAEIAAFDARLAQTGLTVAPGPVMVDQGKQIRDYTLVPR